MAAAVIATLDPDGAVTYEPPPSHNTSAAHYVDAAYEAGGVLHDAREAYLRRNGYTWPYGAREVTHGRFTDLWRKVEAADMSKADREQREREHARSTEAVNSIVAELEKRDPSAAQRAKVVRALTGKGYDRADARRMAREAIPDAPSNATEQTPRIRRGVDIVAGVSLKLTPSVAPGVAYEGRAVLVHAQRGEGKTTLLTWLAARATVDGHRVLVVGDDDEYTWKTGMVSFGANHEYWDYAAAADLAPAGAIEGEVDRYDWIIVDNWRKWGIASGVPSSGGFGNTEATAVPIQRLVDLAAGKRALTIVSNEGAHNRERSRDSLTVEETVHATRKISIDEDSRVTTLAPAAKTRRGIDRITRRWKYRDDETGMDEVDNGSTSGGGLMVDDPQSTIDRAVVGYLMKHPGGVSLRQATQNIPGRYTTVIAAVKRVGMKGTDGRWRAVGSRTADTVARKPAPLPPARPATPLPESVAQPMGNGAATPATPLPIGVARPIVRATRATPRGSVARAIARETVDDGTTREPWQDWPDEILTAERISERIRLAETFGATLSAARPLIPSGALALQIRRLLDDPEKRPGVLVRLGPVYTPPADPWDWPLPAALAALGVDLRKGSN